MFLLKQFLPGIAAAAIIAALVLLVALKFRGGVWAAGLALGFGYAGGHATVTGWPAFPPADTTHWLLYIALGAALAGVLPVRSGWMRTAIRASFCALALCLLLWPKFKYGWTPVQGAAWVAALCVAATLLASCIELGARSSSRLEMSVVVLLVGGGIAAALSLSGSALLGQLALVFDAALAVVCAFSLMTAGISIAHGAAGVIAVLLAGFCLSGYFYAELPASSAILFAVAPAVALVPVPRALSRWPLIQRTGLAFIAVTVAVAFAFRASPPLDY